MDNVILIGYFNETAELCEKCGCTIVGVVDKENPGRYCYLGNDEEFGEKYKEYINIPLVITPDKPSIRKALHEYYKALGFQFKTLIAPDATVSKTAKIAEGCIVQSGCNISSESILHSCVHVNTHANVTHNIVIGKFATIAPDAVVLGYTKIEAESYIGANSTILPYVRVGQQSIVGAGAVVTKDVKDNCTVVGVPARCLDKVTG